MFKTCQNHRFSSIPRLTGDGFEGVARAFSHGNNGVMRFVVNVVIKKDVLHIIVQWDPQRFPWLRDVLHLLPMVVVVPNRKDGFGENEVQNFWIGSHFIRKRFWVGCTQIASQAILPQVPGSTTPLGGESYGIHSQPKMVSQLKSLSLPLSRYDIIYYLEWPLVLYLS